MGSSKKLDSSFKTNIQSVAELQETSVKKTSEKKESTSTDQAFEHAPFISNVVNQSEILEQQKPSLSDTIKDTEDLLNDYLSTLSVADVATSKLPQTHPSSPSKGIPLTQNADAVLGLQNFNTPPLRSLTIHEAINAVKTMRSNVLKDCETIPKNKIESENDKAAKEQKNWNSRVEATLSILLAMAEGLPEYEASSHEIIGYFVSEQPVGILIMENTDTAYLKDIVTHPDSKTAGEVLMEKAVKTSQEWKKDGELSLFAMDDTVEELYREVFGFVEVPDSEQAAYGLTEMKLTPKQATDKWCEINGDFLLKKYLDKEYSFIG